MHDYAFSTVYYHYFFNNNFSIFFFKWSLNPMIDSTIHMKPDEEVLAT